MQQCLMTSFPYWILIKIQQHEISWIVNRTENLNIYIKNKLSSQLLLQKLVKFKKTKKKRSFNFQFRYIMFFQLRNKFFSIGFISFSSKTTNKWNKKCSFLCLTFRGQPRTSHNPSSQYQNLWHARQLTNFPTLAAKYQLYLPMWNTFPNSFDK